MAVSLNTYSLIYTTPGAYLGAVNGTSWGLSHFVPHNATLGTRLDARGTPSTYPLLYTTPGAYAGGILLTSGDIQFVPFNAAIGQKVNSEGVVSTFTLPYTTSGAYYGGVIDSLGRVHWVPYNATVQCVDGNTYSFYGLAPTVSGAYRGGVRDALGYIQYVPFNAEVGMYTEMDTGVVGTYPLIYKCAEAYDGGILDAAGYTHFIPYKSPIGQKVSPTGLVSTYSLIYTGGTYSGGFLDSEGSIHFIPHSATVGQKVSSSGVVSTYSIPYTTPNAFSGQISARLGKIFLSPYSAATGIYINDSPPYFGKDLGDLIVSTYTLPTGHGNYSGGVLTKTGKALFVPAPGIYLPYNKYISYSGIAKVGTVQYGKFYGAIPVGNDIHFCPSSDSANGVKIDILGAPSTYPLAVTGKSFYGGVINSAGDIHLVPGSSNVGQKISSLGVASTYSLIYTTASAYSGGCLDAQGYIHFMPSSAKVGQKVSPAGVVSTYSLSYTTAGAYDGGVLNSIGELIFIPHSARVGQKINANGDVSTFSLAYTTLGAYSGGVLDPITGRVYFIQGLAEVGQCVDTDGIVSTFSLPYLPTATLYDGGIIDNQGELHFVPSGNAIGGTKIKIGTPPIKDSTAILSVSTVTDISGYYGGVLSSSEEIHLVPSSATYGCKISDAGIISTYSLLYTTSNAYQGGVLDIYGFIHFSPFNATVGQKVNFSKSVTTYSLIYTTTGAYSGAVVSSSNGLHFIPYNAAVGQKIDPNNTVSSYSLIYTTTGAYKSGVVSSDGSIYFIPFNATVGQKIDSSGAVSTYSLLYTSSEAYFGGVQNLEGDIVFFPAKAQLGQKINSSGVVSTFLLDYDVEDETAYGGIADLNKNAILFPKGATVLGLSIQSDTTVTTYSLISNSSASYGGGVLTRYGDIYLIPSTIASVLKLDFFSPNAKVHITDDILLLETYQNSNPNRPYTYVTITVGTDIYDITDYILASPLIDRQKEILPEYVSNIRATDAIFSVSNNTKYFSPLNTSSIFYGKNYWGSKIDVYTGFYTSDTDIIAVNQLTVYLDELSIESNAATAKLICIGTSIKLKNSKVGELNTDGTSNPKVYNGTWTFKAIAEDLLYTYAEIYSENYEVADININFTDLSFDNMSVDTALNTLCQAASCELFEGRDGKITIKSFEPIFGKYSIGSNLSDELNILGGTINFSDQNLIYKITVTGDTGVYAEDSVALNLTGRTIEITNAFVQNNSDAADIVSKYITRYGTAPLLIELDVDFMPVLDVGDVVYVTEEQSDLENEEFEVYRLTLDVENFKGRVYLMQSYYTGKYIFFADSSINNFTNATSYDLLFGFYADRDNPNDPPDYILS